MPKESLIAISIVIIYMVVVNIWIRKRSALKDSSDMDGFAVGGRSFKWYMVMFTILATWYTGSCFTGAFGYAVSFGVFALYDTTQVIAGLVFLYVIGPRIWTWGKVHNLYNLPEFIDLRYRDERLSLVIAIYTILIGFPWTVMAFKTFGYVVYALTYGAIPFNVGMIIAALFILSYSLKGGQKGVVNSDFIQGIVMIFGSMILIVVLAFKLFGGFGPMLQEIALKKPELLVIDDAPYWSSVILVGVIGSYCWMEIFNRMFVARSARELKLSTAGAPILGAGMYIMLLLLGIGSALIPEVVADPESGFLTISKMVGGPFMLGLTGIIILAAEISSTDSGLVTGGIVIANNIVKRIKPDLSEYELVKISRIAIIAEASLAVILAMFELPMLMTLAIFTFEHIVHVFPTAIMGILWKKGNSKAAWAGIAVGLPITIILGLLPDISTNLFGSWAPGVIGLAFNIIVYIIVSLLSKTDEYVVDLFDEVNSKIKADIKAESIEN